MDAYRWMLANWYRYRQGTSWPWYMSLAAHHLAMRNAYHPVIQFVVRFKCCLSNGHVDDGPRSNESNKRKSIYITVHQYCQTARDNSLEHNHFVGFVGADNQIRIHIAIQIDATGNGETECAQKWWAGHVFSKDHLRVLVQWASFWSVIDVDGATTIWSVVWSAHRKVAISIQIDVAQRRQCQTEARFRIHTVTCVKRCEFMLHNRAGSQHLNILLCIHYTTTAKTNMKLNLRLDPGTWYKLGQFHICPHCSVRCTLVHR